MDTGPNLDFRAMLLVGAPASGKSTWANAFINTNPGTLIVSSDEFIEEAARKNNKTYSEVFHANIEEASEKAEKKMMDGIIAGTRTIIIDRTNMTKKSRAVWLEKLRFHGYKVYAAIFELPDAEEHARRLKERQGKDIPDEVIKKMINDYEEPTKQEGFVDIFLFPHK